MTSEKTKKLKTYAAAADAASAAEKIIRENLTALGAMASTPLEERDLQGAVARARCLLSEVAGLRTLRRREKAAWGALIR